MRHLATLAFGITLTCFLVATAEAQSPAVQSFPPQNPPNNTNAAPPDGSTQRDLKLEIPDGFGGLKDLPGLTGIDPDPTTGVLITPTDLPPNDNDHGPGR